jgi:hypothetical protein
MYVLQIEFRIALERGLNSPFIDLGDEKCGVADNLFDLKSPEVISRIRNVSHPHPTLEVVAEEDGVASSGSEAEGASPNAKSKAISKLDFKGLMSTPLSKKSVKIN